MIIVQQNLTKDSSYINLKETPEEDWKVQLHTQISWILNYLKYI